MINNNQLQLITKTFIKRLKYYLKKPNLLPYLTKRLLKEDRNYFQNFFGIKQKRISFFSKKRTKEAGDASLALVLGQFQTLTITLSQRERERRDRWASQYAF